MLWTGLYPNDQTKWKIYEFPLETPRDTLEQSILHSFFFIASLPLWGPWEFPCRGDWEGVELRLQYQKGSAPKLFFLPFCSNELLF